MTCKIFEAQTTKIDCSATRAGNLAACVSGLVVETAIWRPDQWPNHQMEWLPLCISIKKKNYKKTCFLILNVLQNFTKDFMINGKTIFRFKLIDPNLLWNNKTYVSCLCHVECKRALNTIILQIGSN